MNKLAEIVGGCTGALIVAIGFLFLWPFVFQYLWNYTVTDIFGLTEIDYWQAFALILLIRLTFPGTGPSSAWNKYKSYNK